MIPLRIASAAAEKVCAVLADTTTACLVAGSVRRRKPQCRDIDIVVVPHFDANLMGEWTGWSQAFLAAVRDCPTWTVETSITPKSRQITVRSVKSPDLKVELWLAFPWNVGWIYLLRTGPSEFGHELVTLVGQDRIGRGFRFREGMLTRDGEMVPVADEAALFAALGLPFAEVEERTVAWLTAQARRQWDERNGGGR